MYGKFPEDAENNRTHTQPHAHTTLIYMDTKTQIEQSLEMRELWNRENTKKTVVISNPSKNQYSK